MRPNRIYVDCRIPMNLNASSPAPFAHSNWFIESTMLGYWYVWSGSLIDAWMCRAPPLYLSQSSSFNLILQYIADLILCLHHRHKMNICKYAYGLHISPFENILLFQFMQVSKNYTCWIKCLHTNLWIGHVNNIPTMHFFTGISRNAHCLWGCLGFQK